MNKPHKWAKEIKAWADGAEIEYSYDGKDWEIHESPSWATHKNHRYRIKPQPKPVQYLYVYMTRHTGEEWVSTEYNDESHDFKYMGKIKLEDEASSYDEN